MKRPIFSEGGLECYKGAVVASGANKKVMEV